ncbi:hypothetical protein CEXT_561911 [Caerostris extrusa]|uniref:Uncharacterized protein n=1 Tax=Caerostris extrusa TaxID=172846 RepID=A0AAV4NK93_CAEEX|nr:hypothetical protein CEXT_561911 [Caerostris extrusa]
MDAFKPPCKSREMVKLFRVSFRRRSLHGWPPITAIKRWTATNLTILYSCGKIPFSADFGKVFYSRTRPLVFLSAEIRKRLDRIGYLFDYREVPDYRWSTEYSTLLCTTSKLRMNVITPTLCFSRGITSRSSSNPDDLIQPTNLLFGRKATGPKPLLADVWITEPY